MTDPNEWKRLHGAALGAAQAEAYEEQRRQSQQAQEQAARDQVRFQGLREDASSAAARLLNVQISPGDWREVKKDHRLYVTIDIQDVAIEFYGRSPIGDEFLAVWAGRRVPVKSLADLGRLLQEKQEYERRWALRDQQNGIRCILHCGPCDTLRLTEQPVTQFHPDRGYAPEYIRRSTGITGVYFVYRWRKRLEAVVRSSSDKGPMYQPAGFYIYDFVGRQGRSTDLRYDDALLVFQGGPLHEQTQWIPNPAEETIPVNRTAQGVSYGKAYKRSDGEYVCTGRVKIRLAARDSTETGKELWLKAVATPGAELGYYPEAFFTGGVSQLLPGTLYAHQHDNVYQLTTGSEIYERALLERLKREASAAVSRLLFYKVKPDVWDEIRTERRYNGIWGASTGGERHVLQGAFGLICKYRGGRLELYYGTSRITSLVDYEQAQSV